MRLRAGIAAFLVIVLAAIALPASPASATAPAEEAQFVAAINAVRAANGLQPLTVNNELTQIARAWAQQMADSQTLAHNPNFQYQVTQNWRMLGENVGVGMTVDLVQDAFVASPDHFHNIVNAEYAEIGVGVAYGANGALYTAHQFMVRFPDEPSVAPAPDPAPVAAVASTPAPSQPAATAAAVVAEPAPAAPAPAPAPAPVAPVALDGVLDGLRRLDAA